MSFEKRLGLVWAACGLGWIRLKCVCFFFNVFKQAF